MRCLEFPSATRESRPMPRVHHGTPPPRRGTVTVHPMKMCSSWFVEPAATLCIGRHASPRAVATAPRMEFLAFDDVLLLSLRSYALARHPPPATRHRTYARTTAGATTALKHKSFLADACILLREPGRTHTASRTTGDCSPPHSTTSLRSMAGLALAQALIYTTELPTTS